MTKTRKVRNMLQKMMIFRAKKVLFEENYFDSKGYFFGQKKW